MLLIFSKIFISFLYFFSINDLISFISLVLISTFLDTLDGFEILRPKSFWNFFISYENFLNESLPVELESKYSEYVKLTMFLLLASGLSFEFPVLIILLTKLKIFNQKFLSRNRKYFFIGILIFSAIFTPPDVISQIGIAIPLIIFYEFSILFIKIFLKDKNA